MTEAAEDDTGDMEQQGENGKNENNGDSLRCTCRRSRRRSCQRSSCRSRETF